MPDFLLILIRSVFSFFLLLVFARLMGKKQISQLTFFDYIVGITIGNIASAIAIDQSVRIMNGIIGVVVWSLLTILLGVLSLKSFLIRRIVEGNPLMLIENGNVLEDNLAKAKMTFDDLMTRLREKSAFKLADVELAVLETDGQVSVMKKAEKQPLTPMSLGLFVEEDHRPQLVIIDGQLMEKKLNEYGYTKEWLLGEIMKQGANDFSDVFLAQIDSKGNVYVDLYDDDSKVMQVKQKPLLAAQLRKAQADLESFALQTNNKEAKKMYYEQSQHLQKLITQLNPLLKE